MMSTPNAIATIDTESVSQLTVVLDRAKTTLETARNAAEILEARETASFVYDAAKRASRLAKAKQANDDVSAAMLRLQADANEAIAASQRRLADEYDAAQERGEVQKHGGQGKRDVPKQNIPSVSDIGLSRKEIHEARELRDAEEAEPGITRKTLDEMVERGQEPSKAALKRELKAKADAEREGNMAKLPPDVRASMEAREAARSRAKADNRDEPNRPVVGPTLEDTISELEAKVESLEVEIAEKDAKLLEFDCMAEFHADWKAGGMDAVRAEMNRKVEYWKEKYHTENREKVAAQRSAKAGWKEAGERGYSTDMYFNDEGEKV